MNGSRSKHVSQHKLSVEKLEGKRLPGRPRHRWDDNIKMDVK